MHTKRRNTVGLVAVLLALLGMLAACGSDGGSDDGSGASGSESSAAAEVSGELNVLLFASHRPPPTSITADLETVANRLRQILDLDFPRYLRRICQGHTLKMGSDPIC